MIWDNVGAQLGVWEFNPAKCTDVTILGSLNQLPMEEICWLFHHVLMASLFQLKCFEIFPREEARPLPPLVRNVGVVILTSLTAFGWWALVAMETTGVKCIGVVFAFFSPLWLMHWCLGERFVRSNLVRSAVGWLVPGTYTVFTDALGQQQGVWRFAEHFMTGYTISGIQLDVALIYVGSTLAATGSGVVVLAATEELLAIRTKKNSKSAMEDDLSWSDVMEYVWKGSCR